MNKPAFRCKEFGLNNKKILFFFAGMGTRLWLYQGPIKRLVKNGYHVIGYDFDPLIVRKGSADTFLETATAVSQDVRTNIEVATGKSINTFHTFGVSMGTLLALKCTAENTEIDKAVINLTYGSVAENVWTWWFIKPAKQRAIKDGYSMAGLDEKLAPVSPIPLAAKLKGKKILLYLSRRDKILLFKQSSQFKQALDKADVDYEYIENKHTGHIASGFMNFWRHQTYLRFLNS